MEAGAGDLFGDGLDTERLLKIFDTMLVDIVPWFDPRIRGQSLPSVIRPALATGVMMGVKTADD